VELKPKYLELSDYESVKCILEDQLSLHYEKNVVEGVKGTVLGQGLACEIVVQFSPTIERGISPTPWGNFTIKYPAFEWQVCSYPACYWIPGKPTDKFIARFGGKFVRSNNLELCKEVNQIIRNELNELDMMHNEQNL